MVLTLSVFAQYTPPNGTPGIEAFASPLLLAGAGDTATIEPPASDAGTPSVIEWLRLHVDTRTPGVFSWEQVIVQ